MFTFKKKSKKKSMFEPVVTSEEYGFKIGDDEKVEVEFGNDTFPLIFRWSGYRSYRDFISFYGNEDDFLARLEVAKRFYLKAKDLHDKKKSK